MMESILAIDTWTITLFVLKVINPYDNMHKTIKCAQNEVIKSSVLINQSEKLI